MHFQDIPDFPNINISRCVDINITAPIREQSLNQEYDIIVGIITGWKEKLISHLLQIFFYVSIISLG